MNTLTEIEWIDPVNAFAEFADEPYAIFFDSSDTTHPLGKISYILIRPEEIISTAYDTLFETLSAQYKERFEENSFPYFTGGWAGYFGYDLAFSLENIKRYPKPASSLPSFALGFYNKGYIFDHGKCKAYAFGRAPKLINQDIKYKPYSIDFKTNFTRSNYEEAVQKIIDYICEGDIFQTNMSQQFKCEKPSDYNAFRHYLKLRSVSPAPFSAFMNFGAFQLLSSSPERFIKAAGQAVETRPIKGTLPKDQNPELLENSEKDRAENIMIVDLLRNDLAITCEDESIDVPQLCQLETFSHVHHLVSTVTGKIRKDMTPFDVLKHAFPGGSITGAPKIRAMEIIEELEPSARGPYCGCLGLIGTNGIMDTNIAIRTLISEQDKLWFNVGGGITAGSNPADEHDETLAKAQGILKSFN